MLGRGIEADGTFQVAVVAAIALVWSFVAPVAQRRETTADLGWILRWAAPTVAAIAVLASFPSLAFASVGWFDIGVTAVLAVCAALVLERETEHMPRGWGVAAVVPLPIAIGLGFVPDSQWQGTLRRSAFLLLHSG